MTHRRSATSTLRARRRAAGRLIRLCLLNKEAASADELLRLVERATEPILLDHASYHRTEGWLYECLSSVPMVSESLLAALKRRRNWAAQRHMHATWQLGKLQPTLDSTGVPWVVIKGPVVAEVLHRSAGRRTYSDLDVLVDPAGIRTVVEAIETVGGRLLDRNWALLHRERRGQVHVALHGRIALDLHWDLINTHRRSMLIDTAEILARRQPVTISGLSIPTPDPTDSLIHLAVHAALSGGDGLVWIKDIERSIAVRPPSWDDVVERSRAWGVDGAVGLLLHRARVLLEADVPEAVPSDLVGRRRLRLAAAIDRRSSVEASRGGPVPHRVMARALGHGVIGGTAILFRRALRHFDPRGQERYSPFGPGDADADRDTFFEEVAGRAPSARSGPTPDRTP